MSMHTEDCPICYGEGAVIDPDGKIGVFLCTKCRGHGTIRVLNAERASEKEIFNHMTVLEERYNHR